MTDNSKDKIADKVIVRFPPSPTGEIHIGNMRTMLFNYLFARQHGGEIFLRFEDTDRERSKREFEDSTINVFKKLGLNYDHGPFRQTDRSELYTKKLKQLLDSGHAYEAEDSEHEPGKKVIRFKNPNRDVTFNDMVRGPITIHTEHFEDFIIARSIDNVIYHFAVVVDDIDMGVTHILRGEDHITSTPRQILLIEALGGRVPEYGHLPVIVGEDKKKLSKRHGATSVSGFFGLGYLPEAIINYLAFLGWNPGDEREFFTLDELVKEFSIEKITKSAAMFNYAKLDAINRHYLLKLPNQVYVEKLKDFLSDDTRKLFESNAELSSRLVDKVLKERINKLSDLSEIEKAGELSYYFAQPVIDEGLLQYKDDSKQRMKDLLTEVKAKLSQVAESDWTVEGVKNQIWDWSGEIGRGSVLHPLRTCLSGRKQSPDPFTLAYVLGKEETLSRIGRCL